MTPIDEAMSADADAYFLNHPQGGKWRETAGSAARRGALELAATDLAGYLAVAAIDFSIAGCRSYRTDPGGDRRYSPRARMLLEPLLRPGRGRFGRG